MRKNIYIVVALAMVASMLLSACGTTATPTAATGGTTSSAASVAPAPATDTPVPPAASSAAAPASATAGPTATPTQYPMAACPAGMTCVRWFIGLGTGTNAVQLPVEQSVVDTFNADPARATDKLFLQMEVVPFDSAKDTILTEIAAGNGPDIVGPVGWAGSAALHGEWADLKANIAKVPEITKQFDPALLASYESSEGQVGLPFTVYPSAIFYNTALFDQAGLKYPPVKYGDKYSLDGKDVVWNWATVKTVAQRLTVDSNGKNSLDAAFDATKIVQYGFSWNFETQPSYVGAFQCNGQAYVKADGKTAQLPDCWKAAWQWTYNGTWGKNPFIPNAQVIASADFGSGNAFNSGKVAMIDQPVWYTCCMAAVTTWDIGALPVSADGKVAGRIDADTFRILKSTKNLDAAFSVLTYLVTTGVQPLVIGTDAAPAPYGALPARKADFAPWLAGKQKAFPWVKNWQLISDGLAYPDSPSAESYMPNFNESWARGQTFYNLLASTGGLDLAKEEATFLTDLQTIFAK
jgi:multiple sugar transport system substrate-binding protein